MITKKKMTRMFRIGQIVGAMLGMGVLIGCAVDTGITEGRNSEHTTASQEVSEHGAGESSGEHGGRTEGVEGSGSRSGSEEDSGAMLAPNETFDMTRSGARLILNYDAATNSFKGTVENTTNSVLTRVRIEVHLSNGTELGPTTPVDMAPGQVLAVDLPSTQSSFIGWVAHAEVGGGVGNESGSEAGGEHGSGGREGGGEHGSGRERRGGG